MAREFRRITFSNAELKIAFSQCGNEIEEKIGSSEIVSTSTLREEQKHYLKLDLFDFSKDKKSELKIDEIVAKDCLLNYCQTHNIPLPRVAEKELRLIESKVCIDMNFDMSKN